MARNQQKTLELFPEETVQQESQAPVAAKPESTQSDSADYSDLKGKTVYVLDCHSLIYQVFHVSGVQELRGKMIWVESCELR